MRAAVEYGLPCLRRAAKGASKGCRFSFVCDSLPWRKDLSERISGARQNSGSKLPHSKKQNAPTGVGARKTGRAFALLHKKSVLGGAGTHFSTSLILPGSYCTCQGES